MTYPTENEIRRAYDAISADGPEAEVTTRLCSLVLSDPLLRDVLDRKAEALTSPLFKDDHLREQLRKSFVIGCIAYGLNVGMRIGEARRGRIENLLAHMRSGHCDGQTPESTAEIIRILEWSLKASV